ncbi:nucleotide pyrophosphohydrolase [Vibrio parahaemolyticus]|nr:nucleotide pyrophosphohydrolase [Vibrio parahaemolyticus]EKC8021184.1 nucleotide pyrophosphohydrolase [Vibrio parahaemolyticus]ELA4962732.1 nucleotide pyrophosphohydrolase [Vibrio parahaemolyticus]ELA6058295.1 nucleotide pyrophosphohydrolase [Vibrio parahaemolyticus]ELA6080933.1 nucleotide pyrophosphohydrolase [Vibrio parahaemolyticus]
MKKFDELYAIATRKSQYDQTNTWFKGVETYLEAIGKEVDEVREEIREDRLCHLEYELGDVLWNYLNVLKALEREKGIDPEKVLERACTKYEQRVSAIESGRSWDEVKQQQKQALNAEHEATQLETMKSK